MTNVIFSDCTVRVDERGAWLALLLDKGDTPAARQFVLSRKDKPYTAELKEYREKRSLDANGMYWAMCNQLAKAIGEKPDNIYLRHIRDIGNYETICIKQEALADFERRWTNNHLGRQIETRVSKLPGCITVLAYYGSSDFDKTEMSKLIDNCIQDCKSIGIEVMSEQERSLLFEDWGN